MLRVVLNRVGGGLLTLIAASFLIFGSLYLAPGDPLAVLLGQSNNVSPELIAQLRAEYRLDDPFFVRYWDWIVGVLSGDLGTSISFQQPVSTLILSRLPNTLILVFLAGLPVVMVGMAVGIAGALRPGLVDRALVNITAVAAAIPLFVTALIAIFLFSVRLRWFPAFGVGDGDFLDRLYHLILPAITLAFGYIGLVARMTRSAVRTELGSEHVTVARSRGISGAVLFRRHALRNALPPIFTISGVLIPGLLVSSQIVEVCFGISGIGSLLIQSVINSDFAVVQATTLIIVVAFVVANLVIDLILPFIDPRLALEGKHV